ncbi:serine hydrolase [Mycobacterium sp. CBMA293]|uniref:serine hydrolase domain-containing protein n=1 Tax=unclassified Mycolicibacterium TaxID=2636767 RepID=UPI001320EC7C|nr:MULTISPECIES: serine hydrolase [unclassified Mycolicibacterium]MUL49377.1 serine hydrolase [Mycolicibacterium sp. CBMA 360]MUL96783.1 serine hydrolase [Mycolicibacterium sp. CBMA 230]MUM34363.1 serine hydrolase [Mycolicibacterium sp. CBMA 361]MUL57718.1 serine hydrolase [Mycolicibacterium sp. CBMA 335]MUL72833.1 serine hydrolase [Mycolicibacterium sp. CBMA 311]
MLGADPGRTPSPISLANWQSAPHLHWSFQHIAELLPTATISRGAGPVAPLPAAYSDIAAIAVTLPDGAPSTVGQVMAATATDGWIVTHRGRLLAEQYYGGMQPGAAHLLMSVSKTLIAAVTGALVGAGVLNVDSLASDYVPALANSGYYGATVRHLLDMRSGIAFSEDYLDPAAEVRVLEQAIGWAPRTYPDVPATMYDFLLTLRQKTPHGGPFEYRSCETDVLGWVCEAAAGSRMPDLLSQLVWSRIGAAHDANIGVDSMGSGMFDGGISASLADLVRFGSLYLNDGVSLLGEQVLPAAWIADTLAGGQDSREAFAYSPGDNRMPGGMYRNQLWFPYPGNDVLLCLGIHGQMIYVNRPAGVVAAKLSSWPLPQHAHMLFSTLNAFDAVSAAVRS